MNWIEVNGTSLRYELSGSGKTTLVLVHEMGGTLDSWDQVVPALNNTRQRAALRHARRRAVGEDRRHASPSTTWPMISRRCWMRLAITGKVAIGRHRGRRRHRHPFRRASRGADRRAGGDQPGHRRRRRIAARPRWIAPQQPRRRACAASVEQGLANSYPPEVRHNAEEFRKFRARWLANDPQSFAAINRMLAEFHGHRGTAAHRLPHSGDRLHA